MKITKTQLREIIKEEIQSIKEATETAEWTKDEIALIKRTKVKVDGKMHKYSIVLITKPNTTTGELRLPVNRLITPQQEPT